MVKAILVEDGGIGSTDSRVHAIHACRYEYVDTTEQRPSVLVEDGGIGSTGPGGGGILECRNRDVRYYQAGSCSRKHVLTQTG